MRFSFSHSVTSIALLLLVSQAVFPSVALAECNGGTAGYNAQGSCILQACNSNETNVGTCKTVDTGTTGACCVPKAPSDDCTVSYVTAPGTCRKDSCLTGESPRGACTAASGANGQCCIPETATSCTVKDISGADVKGDCLKSCDVVSGIKDVGACSGGRCCIPDSTVTSYFETYGYNPPLGRSTTIPQIIAGIISKALPVIGALFFVMFLWGGIQWMMAGGDAKKLTSARTTLVNAAIGVTIVISAYAIVTQIVKTLGAAG